MREVIRIYIVSFIRLLLAIAECEDENENVKYARGLFGRVMHDYQMMNKHEDD